MLDTAGPFARSHGCLEKSVSERASERASEIGAGGERNRLLALSFAPALVRDVWGKIPSLSAGFVRLADDRAGRCCWCKLSIFHTPASGLENALQHKYSPPAEAFSRSAAAAAHAVSLKANSPKQQRKNRGKTQMRADLVANCFRANKV